MQGMQKVLWDQLGGQLGKKYKTSKEESKWSLPHSQKLSQ